jgi:predicted nucleic acid-binding protein
LSGERRIASDTGPLITLEKLSNGYRFIRLLYDKILIPRVVLEELVQGQFLDSRAYIGHYGIADLLQVVDVQGDREILGGELLDSGELKAIQLALEAGLPLLIEEEAGRQVARQMGLQFSGVAGQILHAFRTGLIPAAEAAEMLGELFRAGRINRKIYEGLLEAVRGTSDPRPPA